MVCCVEIEIRGQEISLPSYCTKNENGSFGFVYATFVTFNPALDPSSADCEPSTTTASD